MATKKPEAGKALEPVLEGGAMRSAFRRRKDVNDYQKVPLGDEKKYLRENWVVHKEMQSHV
jgi:hypothetical protein